MFVPTPEFSTLCTLLDTSEQILSSYFSQMIPFTLKENRTPVSKFDQKVEKEMCKIIGKKHPSHAIYGEEYGLNRNRQSSSCWFIDPIDGTKSLLTGVPLFGSMCAYTHRGKPILSGIAFPGLHTRFFTDGQRSYKGDQPITTSACDKIQKAKLATTAHIHFTTQELEIFHRVSDRVAFTRYGGDCFNYACLASGHVDVIVEAGLAPHDYVPLVPIVEKAGGIISDWQGNPLHDCSQLQSKQIVAAATSELHEQVLTILLC